MGRPTDTRERLLDAAQRLVWEQSYGSVGIEAICQEAGVNKGSFYHFFPSKAELVAEALEAYCDGGRAALDAAFSASRPPLERLWTFFATLEAEQRARRAKHGHTLGCPLASAGTELATQDAALAERVQGLLARNRRYVETTVRDAQAEGSVRTDVKAAVLADAVFTFLEGVMVRARINDDPAIRAPLEAGARLILGLKPHKS